MAFLPEIFVESLEEILCPPKRSFCARKNPSKVEDSEFSLQVKADWPSKLAELK